MLGLEKIQNFENSTHQKANAKIGAKRPLSEIQQVKFCAHARFFVFGDVIRLVLVGHN